MLKRSFYRTLSETFFHYGMFRFLKSTFKGGFFLYPSSFISFLKNLYFEYLKRHFWNRWLLNIFENFFCKTVLYFVHHHKIFSPKISTVSFYKYFTNQQGSLKYLVWKNVLLVRNAAAGRCNKTKWRKQICPPRAANPCKSGRPILQREPYLM
jgi:hypothetical protein